MSQIVCDIVLPCVAGDDLVWVNQECVGIFDSVVEAGHGQNCDNAAVVSFQNGLRFDSVVFVVSFLFFLCTGATWSVLSFLFLFEDMMDVDKDANGGRWQSEQ